ncbi:MAG: hypothetical protein ACLFTG_00980 [Alphaproteobacteria bacterium]
MTVSFPPLSSPVISEPQTTAAPDPRPRPEALEERVARAAAHGLPEPHLAGDGPDPAKAAEAVAKALSGSDHLDVRSFHDEGTGRFVTRVADKWSGRVLIQTPPEDLLRFLASAPAGGPPPTVIDA